MPNNNPSCSRLLVAAGAVTIGLGIVGAHAAPLVQAPVAAAMAGAPIPIVDSKGGLGGAAGGGIGADVGGAGAGVSAGADVGGTDAGASTGADDGATDAGAGAAAGGVDADGSAGTGDGSADAGASVGAGSGGTDDGAASGAGAATGAAPSGDAPADAPASNDTTGSGDGPSSNAGGSLGAGGAVSTPPADPASGAAPSRATAAISPDGAAGEAAAIDAHQTSRDDPIAAATTVDVPPEGVTGTLLPVGPGAREGRSALGAPRQDPIVGCSDPAETGACAATGSAQTGTLSRSNTASAPSGGVGVRSVGAAARPPATQPAMPPAAPLGGGLGISLVDPVRQANGLVVQGVIVNTSGQSQAIPPMQLSLLDKANQVVQRYKLTPPAIALAPGAHKTFKTVIQPLPPGVTRVTTAFIAKPAP
jgi:hypothetical protein